jgi:hypothetical protein
MTITEISRSISGILRPFKKLINEIGLSEQDPSTYYGCVGTCTPFVELHAPAIRSLPVEQV